MNRLRFVLDGWRRSLGLLLGKRSGRQLLGGIMLLLLFLLLSLVLPIIGTMEPYTSHRRSALEGPSKAHPFGTDEIGRDMLARVLYGSRISLCTIVVTLVLSVPLGTLVGVSAGFLGGVWDMLIMRVIDIWLSFPGLIVAIVLVVAIGSGPMTAMIAIGIISIPKVVRITRSKTLSLRQMAFVEATRAAGASNTYIILRTLLPNIMGIVYVQMALIAGFAVLMEATLSFLGLGSTPPVPSWGSLLRKSITYLSRAPWYGISPGVFLTGLILITNMIADALNRIYRE